MPCIYSVYLWYIKVVLYSIVGQVSTPTSPTYVAAVVEYNAEIGVPGDTSILIVGRNLANYVQYITEAAEQVDVL